MLSSRSLPPGSLLFCLLLCIATAVRVEWRTGTFFTRFLVPVLPPLILSISVSSFDSQFSFSPLPHSVIVCDASCLLSMCVCVSLLYLNTFSSLNSSRFLHIVDVTRCSDMDIPLLGDRPCRCSFICCCASFVTRK